MASSDSDDLFESTPPPMRGRGRQNSNDSRASHAMQDFENERQTSAAKPGQEMEHALHPPAAAQTSAQTSIVLSDASADDADDAPQPPKSTGMRDSSRRRVGIYAVGGRAVSPYRRGHQCGR